MMVIDKFSRQYRKHYATNGRMEVKQDIVNGTVEFITYIGGDAYSAPVILKSDGTTQQYMYLHRDYLGSIVAVTNQTGSVIEKRLFDAWGNIKAIQDGNGNVLTKMIIIERGYTGHEHLQGVNIIHMNGRLYGPVVHRFYSLIISYKILLIPKAIIGMRIALTIHSSTQIKMGSFSFRF